MPKVMTITVPDDVKAAIDKKAASDGISAEELLQKQLEYYIGCALHKHFDPNLPINTPGLSISERLLVYAEAVNNGQQAAENMVNDIIANR